MASRKDTNKQLATLQERLQELHAEAVSIMEEIQTMASDQREAYDNMPESLQQTDNGMASEARADKLDEIAETLEGALDELDTATQDMEVE